MFSIADDTKLEYSQRDRDLQAGCYCYLLNSYENLPYACSNVINLLKKNLNYIVGLLRQSKSLGFQSRLFIKM